MLQKRHPWSNIDEESMDLYITKLLPMNNLFQNESPIGITLDQFDDRQPHLQKRGRRKFIMLIILILLSII